ncbi:MAG: ribose-phosphate diphosphokinase [Candidatus Aenigmarchaeota archaeon]|nr:ribose-phosphate diphosphokinase [Candidatus Aenigmarchaeota archaeon]
MIVAGRDRFSEMLANELNAKYVEIGHRVFPDGESYFRLKEQNIIKGQPVILVVRAKTPGTNLDGLVTESVILLDYIRSLGPSKLCLLLPYQPYSRQDQQFLRGEPVSSKIIRKTLSKKCDLLVNVASHDFRKEGWISRNMYNVSGLESAITLLKMEEHKNAVVIAPDMTENGNVQKIAKVIGAGTISIMKERDKVTGDIESEEIDYDFGGKDVIIYDDVTSSGATLLKTIHRVKTDAPRRITVIVIHAIACYNPKEKMDSIEMIRETRAKFHSSDTIETPVTSFSVIPETAKRLREIFR